MRATPKATDLSRVVLRVVWLAGEVVLGLARFAALCAIHGRVPTQTMRARWLQHTCRRALRIFDLQLRVSGPVPLQGLLVCNHLSYLDILVLAALTPCVFIAKYEVKKWLVFGWFALLAGTLFIRRDKRSEVARMNKEMRRILDARGLIVLFPEGTTSDGRGVLPFKSALLEPAASHGQLISAAYIGYSLRDGDVAEEVCYWKDMTLLPHLLNLFAKDSLDATLRFAQVREPAADRKQLARQLHTEVVRLKTHSPETRPDIRCKVCWLSPTNSHGSDTSAQVESIGSA